MSFDPKKLIELLRDVSVSLDTVNSEEDLEWFNDNINKVITELEALT